MAARFIHGSCSVREEECGARYLQAPVRRGRVSSCASRASLVPVFSFGEKELFQQYPNPPGSWVRRVQEALQAMLSVALPLFHGRLGLLLPFREPIHTEGESCIFPIIPLKA